MDAMQWIRDLVLMLMLAAALSIGLVHVQAQEDPANADLTAECAFEAHVDEGDRSEEWIDPLEGGRPGPH